MTKRRTLLDGQKPFFLTLVKIQKDLLSLTLLFLLLNLHVWPFEMQIMLDDE